MNSISNRYDHLYATPHIAAVYLSHEKIECDSLNVTYFILFVKKELSLSISSFTEESCILNFSSYKCYSEGNSSLAFFDFLFLPSL